MLFKVSKMVHYPELLDLSQFFCGNGLKEYVLYGVINHVGMLNSGHYYSYVRDISDSNEEIAKQWYCCNDSRVDKISNEDALNSNNAYMLFYTSKN